MPSDYAGIEMIFLSPSLIWKPDIMFGNEMNPDNRDALYSDTNLIRIWAERSPHSDLPDTIFNVEWTPLFNLQVHHSYDLKY